LPPAPPVVVPSVVAKPIMEKFGAEKAIEHVNATRRKVFLSFM
jgi:hypothetical protein